MNQPSDRTAMLSAEGGPRPQIDSLPRPTASRLQTHQ
jgi:hypothetical protein